jgi:hypothetical protein
MRIKGGWLICLFKGYQSTRCFDDGYNSLPGV